MAEITTYPNLLSGVDFENLKRDMLGTWFPWYFFEKSVPDETLKEQKAGDMFFQSSVFRHRFYDNYQSNSNWAAIVDCIVNNLSKKTGCSYKIKASYANLLTLNNLPEGVLDVPHVDRSEQNGASLTGVFYLTTSEEGTTIYDRLELEQQENCDGVALFEKLDVKQVVAAEENKLVLFDCRQYHSAPASCKSDRLVINLNIDMIEGE